MYLLDTMVLSELRRPDRADPGLAGWAAGAAPADEFVSAITLFEIELGAALLGRKDPTREAVLRAWIDRQLLPAFDGRILAVDAGVARRCAGLHVPLPRPQRDSLIAATALVHGLVLVTRNQSDFAPMGVRLLNPWSGR
ncbi:type II toxin-antitoxin system VapC family toxin [Azospirillum sp. RWY-5-1]|uniref:Ribonuclease VapC n=1 Tax=Azospirillum oleiclasticum TaxID=2735135 RepID=A0ABX2TIW6_9PROT|nr:type II toxin-antitoxin system VapC family toxin [Azospirillum oleiclasticum]NYZ16208.1 type II toxin-antitoxin system VapC family toxin [Azospirillum oleiclasticum]NYZ23695.1 type II toxin-antitoxin system VapC family toxin [Azospirillum oleiclasticum]